MNITVDVGFTRLICVHPDESHDDPYLWIFWFKLDGDTVRQVVPGTTGTLAGSVSVVTSQGSHGNLGVEDVNVGALIAIPPSIGRFTTRLRPIVLDVIGQQIVVPGRLIAIVQLLDEDSSPDGAIETAHQDVRQVIEQGINGFLSQLSIQEIIDDATARFQTNPNISLENHLGAAFEDRLRGQTAAIRQQADQAVELDVLAAHTPGAIWEFLDADEPLSDVMVELDLRELLLDQAGLSRPLNLDLVGRDDDNVIESFYRLIGGVSVTVQGSPNDLRTAGRVLDSRVADSGSHTIQTSSLCASPGTVVRWTRRHVFEELSFVFLDGLVPPVWTIDGQELHGDTGTITLRGKDCTMEYFDPAKPGKPAHRGEIRDVELYFERFAEGVFPGLRLRNRPDDGAYFAELQVRGALPTTRPLLTWGTVAFTGQLVESPYFAEYQECIDRFRSPGYEYAPSRRIGPKELWGPAQRHRWFEEQLRAGERLVETGRLSQARFDAIRTVLQQKLRITG